MSASFYAELPLLANALIFCAAAAVVWFAGSRLTVYVDAIGDYGKLGSAFAGILLLGGITSLPEVAVTVTAGIAGNAALAVNNILGGVALQVVIISIGDMMLVGRALTSVIGTPRVLLQGVFGCLLLCIVITGIAAGDVAVLGVGVASMAILGFALFSLYFLSRAGSGGWSPNPQPDIAEPGEVEGRPPDLRSAIRLTVFAALVIIVAGFLLARTGEALATQTGLGSSFVGALFVGVATSLPEISTVIAAVRLKRYLLAISDIFGTNIIDLALIALADIVFLGGPVLNEVGTFSTVGAALGIVVTLLYVAGLVERRDQTIGRLGIDSWAVVLAYIAGAVLLYTLR